MKTFLVLCTAAALTGCAVYPAPGHDPYGNAGPVPYGYGVEQPRYIYGGTTVYRTERYPYPYGFGHPRGYPHAAPPPVVVVPAPRPGRPFVQAPRPWRGNGDRDGDGVPNRVDRDRDGDGIPNRMDRDRNNNGIPNRVERSRDRDGDGISDRIDPRPNIPNRR